MKKKFILSVFTEDVVGMLQRVTLVFTRRHVNISSITAGVSEIPSVYRYTIAVHVTEDMAKKLTAQLAKQVDVLRVFSHEADDVVDRTVALYKVSAQALHLEKAFNHTLRQHHAHIVSAGREYVVVEKCGSTEEIDSLFHALEPFGILEFNRSGEVVVTKPMKTLLQHLQEDQVLKELTS